MQKEFQIFNKTNKNQPFVDRFDLKNNGFNWNNTIKLKRNRLKDLCNIIILKYQNS